MEESIKVTGIIRFREIPVEWTEADVAYWWFPELDCGNRIIRKARMSEREKERRTVAEYKNLLTTSGRNALLSFMGTNTGSTFTSFAAYMSLGNTSVVSVYPSDTGISGEYFRKQPSSATITGNTVDVATTLITTDAVGLITNGGLWGGSGVSSTLGSGVLYTHSLVLPNFQKANGSSYVLDYSLSLN